MCIVSVDGDYISYVHAAARTEKKSTSAINIAELLETTRL